MMKNNHQNNKMKKNYIKSKILKIRKGDINNFWKFNTKKIKNMCQTRNVQKSAVIFQ